ncbi:MAG: TraV family lipoprotein [Proteobacteria bacterium]|nr:TraV family lipoprotein [Pseudomonadota bacterium]
MKNIVIIFSVIFLVSGCTSVWNPYESEFRCTGQGNEGRCTSTMGAYNESLGVVPMGDRECDDCCEPSKKKDHQKDKKQFSPTENKHLSPEQVYNKNRYDLMTQMVREEKPPVVIPPEVVRVLILPYKGADNRMYGFRFSYFFATEPQWQFAIGKEGDE